MEILAGYIIGVLTMIVISKKGFNITIRQEFEDKTSRPNPSVVPDDFEKDEYPDKTELKGTDDFLHKLNDFMTGGDEDGR